ncbi:hypothetical protein GCM10023191_005460 [Actinoallomurus oryzae]|uniref:DUF397 domain-containing protein n=1 Tax=Actinoallomurus oryzae TaxID=502180 RepID=A0ABP8P9N5_9ACTN
MSRANLLDIERNASSLVHAPYLGKGAGEVDLKPSVIYWRGFVPRCRLHKAA